MYQFKGLDDTIAAIATASGSGGIGIVRLSGPDSVLISDQIFMSKSGQNLQHTKTGRIVYGWIKKNEQVIDEVLVSIMRSPKSYTTEDVVEINCHGGMVAVKAILDEAINAGARLAEPGEFTKRAFIHGRIDLAQAEAVLDIINAKTQSFLRTSTHQLKGDLSSELDSIREQLMNVYTQLEAMVNFPEDDVDPQTVQQILDMVSDQEKRVQNLLLTADNGRILKDGIRVVLCGKPNVGKSSLLNVLLKQERAIVTPVEGTTRDVIEESAQIKGIPFKLIDTAGLLDPRDEVEEEAVKRSHLFIDSADLILILIDVSRSLSEFDLKLLEKLKNQNSMVILNKTDLESVIDEGLVEQYIAKDRWFYVSAETRLGVSDLEEAIVSKVWKGEVVDDRGLLISNIRHVNSLGKAKDCLQNAYNNLQNDFSFEFISEDIKSAVNELDAITGRNIDVDLIDKIFAEFCIGK